MSASREKRTRQDQAPESLNEKQLQQNETKKSDRSYGVLFGIGAAVIAIVAVVLLVFNSNFLQNRAVAVTINGENYTAADVSYYYTSIYQYQSYYAMMGMSTLDPSVDPREQVYNETDGTTWYDFMLDQAITSMTQEVALATEAEKAGFTLSAEAQESVKSTLASVDAYGYSNRDAFLTANFGSAMTYDKYVECLNRSALAVEYANAQAASYEYDRAELDAYYEENKDAMDTYVMSQYLFQATVPTETDAEGNTIERTEEETAALLEEAKKEAKANAEELLARLEAGEDADKLNEEFADKLTYSYVSETRLGSTVNTEYSQWAFDPARKDGDAIMVEYEGASSSIYNYCVARLEDRYLDNAATANIRHIFIGAGSDPTEEAYAEALATAEEMLAQWKADGAVEDDFAQLAMEHSGDSSSAASGGLLNVSTYDGYGQAFVDWALDPSRQSGETGLIKNDFSTTKGYHIMYYVSTEAPYWEQMVKSTLLSADVSAWQDGIFNTYTAEKGPGLKYVGQF